MNDVDLSARLRDLAAELTGPDDAVSAESAVALYRRRRRTRAGLVATIAAVVAIAVGVPTAVGSLSSSDGEVAVPSAPTTVSSPPPTTPRTTTPSSPATTESRPDPADEAELLAVAAGLPPLSLSSPANWDQWLPEGKPYPGVDLEDDLSTCPVLSARLETVVGQEMSYWTGTLPNGPGGCTWVEIPLSGQDNDYDYVISVGFLADGTTVESFRHYREGPGQGTHACPSIDLPSVAAGALLVRCSATGATTYTLAVPDTRLDGGLWTLLVQSKDSTPVRPADIVPVLVDGVAAAFG